MTKPTLFVYADGSCLGNPGPGGYAWRVVRASDNFVVSESSHGFADNTTNNRMELESLRSVFLQLLDLHHKSQLAPCTVALRLDSQYVLKGLFEWLPTWKAKNYKKVSNDDLWRSLETLYEKLVARGFNLVPDWVKGHANDAHNNAVDAAAMRAATAAKNNPQNGVHKTTQPSVDTHDSSKVVPHDATAAARTLLLVARDPSTTPESFLVELRAMAGRLGLHS